MQKLTLISQTSQDLFNETVQAPACQPCLTRRRSGSNRTLALMLFCAAVAIAAQAQTFTTLVAFDGTNGSNPTGFLVQGLDGQLYGSTNAGGNNGNCSGIAGCGTLFKTTTDGTLTTTYDFCPVSQCFYGRTPAGNLAQDAAGNIYGTTAFGGTAEWGEFFRITPSGLFVRLYNFCTQSNCSDGTVPFGRGRSADGSFYGTTESTVFRVTPRGALTTLYTFCALPNCSDGQEPNSLVQVANGNFYGTTQAGGSSGRGTAFRMSPSGALTTLHSFCNDGSASCTDGSVPAELIQATDGNFYGVALSGGANEWGTIFKISASGTFTNVYSFCSQAQCADGTGAASLIQATDGNFYGTTGGGGVNNGGTIFRLTPSGTLTTLYDFCQQSCPNTPYPYGLVQHTDGSFYGLTLYGGSGCGVNGCGTIFKLSTGLSPFVKTLEAGGKVGSTVEILGTNLTGATSVSFHGKAAAFSVVSASEITATVPPGATTGKIQVVTPGNTLVSNVSFYVRP